MKKSINFKLILICLIILFLCNSKISYSQFDELGQECGTQGLGGLTNIPVKTPGSSDYLRCLVIYITFPDNTTSGYNYTIWKNAFQTQNPRPINPHSGTNGHLIDSLVGNPNDPFMTRYHDYTISDFFCEMSMGQYDVIGDEIAITLPRNSLYYRDSLHFEFGGMNLYVLKYLDSTRNIDWTRYDNWNNVNNQWIFEPNGQAEMILMNYRTIPHNNDSGWFWNSSWGGNAELGITDVRFDNVTIGWANGITALNLHHATGRSEIILEHEYSHKLFGYNIPLSTDGKHINMGFMTPGHGATTYLYTPMERSAPVIDYTPINLIDQTGIYTFTLPDYTESGVSYKIKIPNTSNEYVWIANHQKKSVYDGISRGGKNCYNINFAEIDPACPDGKGLFVYREGFNCSNFNQPYDIVSAEGKFNWTLDRNVYVPVQNYHQALGISLPISNTLSGSRYSGRDEYRKLLSATGWFPAILTDDMCSEDPNSFSISWDDRGDGLDGFNIGYEEIFSPYSNPSSSSCISSNTGLTVSLGSQDSTNGEITVKIYYNNDVQALTDLPPSKPKSVKVTKSYFGGTGSDQFHPSISWDQNIEPDFYSASNGPTGITPVYEIYRGGSSDCNVEPGYVLAATVSSNTTQYIDYEVTLHDPNFDQNPICPPTIATFSYEIIAKDNRGLRSLNSERGLVSGYQNGCTEAEGPDSHTGNNISTDKFSLSNYPNPFNPDTKIYYSLPKDGMVRINVYNNLGQKIKEIVYEFKTTGKYYIEFEGSSLPSGIYYYKIEVDLAGRADGFIQTKKMLLIK